LLHPFSHFGSRFVRESHSQDLFGQAVLLVDEVGDLVSNGPGFSTARSGEYQHRAVDVFDCTKLLSIELGGEVNSTRHHGLRIKKENITTSGHCQNVRHSGEVTESGELFGDLRTSQNLSRIMELKALVVPLLRVEPSANYKFYLEEAIRSRYSSKPARDPL
jgi:hypothetical protein